MERYGVWVIARHDDVSAALADPQTFCSSAGIGFAHFGKKTPWRKPSIILEADPPEHSRTRKVLTRTLSPGALAKLRATFEAEAARFVDAAVERGSFDAVEHLAEADPPKGFGDAVGLPKDGRENLMPYGDMVFHGFGPINERFKARMEASRPALDWINAVCQRDPRQTDARKREFSDAGRDVADPPRGVPMSTRHSAPRGPP